MSGSSWLLGGGYPWWSGDDASRRQGVARGHVVVDPDEGLSLAALPAGPYGLASPDDSLGRLTLPRGVALDGETLLILSADGARVYRYDAQGATLRALPEVGVEGLPPAPPDAAFAEPRRFRNATGIAAHDGVLWVSDPEHHRVQVFELATLALLRIHTGLERPDDLATGGGRVFVLDRGAGRVYEAWAGRDDLAVAVELPPVGEATRAADGWDRLAVDQKCGVYVRSPGAGGPVLDVFDLSGRLPVTAPAERVTDAGQVRSRFDPPAVTSGPKGFALDDRLLDPCGLRTPLGEAVPRWQIGERLYVLDLEARALLVRFLDGRLRSRLGPCDGSGAPVSVDDPDVWQPVDMADAHGTALVLDARHQAVLAHVPGGDALRPWFSAPRNARPAWQRIAIDDGGCLLLWDGASATADRVSPRGRPLGTVRLHEVRAAFDRARTTRQPGDTVPRMWLTRAGPVPAPAREPPAWPSPAYETHGKWTSKWLDSGIYDCAWDVVELSFADLPPASRLVLRVRTANDEQKPPEVEASLAAGAASGAWREAPPFSGVPQPEGPAPHPLTTDVLVPSPPGQFLQLQLELSGDGVTTPRLASARLRFPHESLLEYLPAIYSSPPEQRDFLDRLLSIVQATWSGIEREVATFARYLDPRAVPPEALAYLASWVDLRLEGGLTADQNRRRLGVLPKLRARWGTVEGMRRWIRVHLALLAGRDEDALEGAGIPGIVERFVERRRLWLGASGARLGGADPLWSPSVERRFQLGVFDRAGEVELVSTGDPDADVFRQYAHAFRVYVPSACVRTAAAEALLRRAIDLQRPAHATYELVLVEPRFRVGVQSTLELDAVVGGAAAQPLPCERSDGAPSRSPFQRLGHDAVLGRAPVRPALTTVLRDGGMT